MSLRLIFQVARSAIDAVKAPCTKAPSSTTHRSLKSTSAHQYPTLWQLATKSIKPQKRVTSFWHLRMQVATLLTTSQTLCTFQALADRWLLHRPIHWRHTLAQELTITIWQGSAPILRKIEVTSILLKCARSKVSIIVWWPLLLLESNPSVRSRQSKSHQCLQVRSSHHRNDGLRFERHLTRWLLTLDIFQIISHLRAYKVQAWLKKHLN